jgi:hypothetical protein
MGVFLIHFKSSIKQIKCLNNSIAINLGLNNTEKQKVTFFSDLGFIFLFKKFIVFTSKKDSIEEITSEFVYSA